MANISLKKNGEGILAFISNNSFIDGITHRQMRKHLLEVFDKIYILDLHGNAKKQETTQTGSKDENVFDIMQGVSINLFVKNNKQKRNSLAEVNHYDLYGLRKTKYETLRNNSLSSIAWERIPNKESYYFWVPKDFSAEKLYLEGFSISELFLENNTGIQTKRDKLVYQFSKSQIEAVVETFKQSENVENIRGKYKLPADGRDWSIEWAKRDILSSEGNFFKVHYHPFDFRYTYFTGNSKGFMAYPRTPLSQNLLKENIALLAVRNSRRGNVNNYFVTNTLVDKDGISPFDNVKFFPLYLYPENNVQQTLDGRQERQSNLDLKIVKHIAEQLGLTFTAEKEDRIGTFAPLDLLDYIYAVLHSPTYRETYKEFLKIDFPRVPYPKDQETFWQLAALGAELRQLHLLEHPKVQDFITAYPQDGDNRITRKITKKDYEITDLEKQRGRVWINDAQYFDNVPRIAWEFYIGGYQPAQKWLKDRHGRRLNFDDIRHYQQMIVALTETVRLMQEIDRIDFLE